MPNVSRTDHEALKVFVKGHTQVLSGAGGRRRQKRGPDLEESAFHSTPEELVTDDRNDTGSTDRDRTRLAEHLRYRDWTRGLSEVRAGTARAGRFGQYARWTRCSLPDFPWIAAAGISVG